MSKIVRCARCVMDDESDKSICFDESGKCNYCSQAVEKQKITYFPDAEGLRRLNEKIAEIKANGSRRKYDAIMGISGGLDSSYLAFLAKKWGLRVLLVHIDDGFDTDISKNNLRKLVATTGYDNIVISPDNNQYYALLKAYMKAGVPNIAVPQDSILFACIYKLMRQKRIKYFLSGGNFALESILQKANASMTISYPYVDATNIRAINKKFGSTRINKLPLLSTVRRMLDIRIFHIETPCLLNYIDYNRDRAFSELSDFCGFEYYGRKHLENVYTAFLQLYWLPRKFGVDKRKSHLSSMIISGQMTRENALNELSQPMFNEEIMDAYIEIIKTKLNISEQEFSELMSAPTHQHIEYKTESTNVFYALYMAIVRLKNRKPMK